MTKQRKEDIRLGFFKKHRRDPGFSSVCVRERPVGEVYIDVEVTEKLPIGNSYEGIPVRMTLTTPFVNAVLPISEQP
jgi:hypothetical protein